MDTAALTASWVRDDELVGHSVGRFARTPTGWLVHGTEVLAGPGSPSGPPDGPMSCSFVVWLGPDGTTRRVQVTAVTAAGQRQLRLDADEDRRWLRDGQPVPELDGCLDVDITATPVTNTFPIRRLTGLTTGASATLPVAWVEVPGMRVTRVEQTYRRLGPTEWEYSDPTHGAFRLTVDPDGLVLDYEGFARRIR